MDTELLDSLRKCRELWRHPELYAVVHSSAPKRPLVDALLESLDQPETDVAHCIRVLIERGLLNAADILVSDAAAVGLVTPSADEFRAELRIERARIRDYVAAEVAHLGERLDEIGGDEQNSKKLATIRDADYDGWQARNILSEVKAGIDKLAYEWCREATQGVDDSDKETAKLAASKGDVDAVQQLRRRSKADPAPCVAENNEVRPLPIPDWPYSLTPPIRICEWFRAAIRPREFDRYLPDVGDLAATNPLTSLYRLLKGDIVSIDLPQARILFGELSEFLFHSAIPNELYGAVTETGAYFMLTMEYDHHGWFALAQTNNVF